MLVRLTVSEDRDAVWRILEPVIRAGTLPGAFQHPSLGFVDVYVMYRSLFD